MMVLQLRVTLCLAFLYASAAIRARDPDDIKGLVSSESVTVCGDDDIWNDITSPKNVRGIKAIGWKGIGDIMANYVDVHKGLVEASDKVITNLKKTIKEKEAKATSRPITDDEIRNLVEQSVADQTSFGSKEAAEATRCGKPGLRFEDKKPNPDGFENSKEVMQGVAESFFKPGVESDVNRFTRVCEDYLGFQRTGDTVKDDLESFCDELCADLAQEAQTISDAKGAGSKQDVRKLKGELIKQEKKRQELLTEQTQCADNIVRVESFQQYLEKLAGDLSNKHKAFQTAEWALYDASEALEKLTKNLLAQQSKMEKAQAGLSDLGQAATQAQEQLATADAQKKEASASLAIATDQWQELVTDLEGVKAAEKYADEVKERLSLLLLKMDGYVEECVREPVRNIGLSEETKVYDGEFFTWDVQTLPAKEDLNSAFTAFHDYCENTAKGIFDLVKDKVDLSPLCELQPQKDTMEEIVTTIQNRKNSVVESITGVQSWLDPFKGTDVTAQTEKPDFVDQGEPLGLRRVMNMGLEEFYGGYLKKWKKHGEFLELIASITAAIDDLNTKVGKAADAMNKVVEELEAAENQLAIAVATFQKAEQAANLEKSELTDVIQDLESQVTEANQNLEDLKNKVAEAKKQWKNSQDTLLTQHASALGSFAQKYAAISKLG